MQSQHALQDIRLGVFVNQAMLEHTREMQTDQRQDREGEELVQLESP